MFPPQTALVIVPGACHHPSHYEALAGRLKAAGHEVSTVDLPSTGGEKPLHSLRPDIAAIQHAIRRCLDRGQNVALVMHSFGGISGSASVQDLLPKDREDGVGLVKLIYLAAILVDARATAMPPGASHPPAVHFPLPDPKDAGWMSFHDPTTTFYGECTPEVQESSVAKLRLFSEGLSYDVMPYAGWKDVQSHYLLCGKDNVLPVQLQEMWSRSPGGRWKGVESLETDHSPFLSRTEETAAFVLRCVGD
ncbi:hypothetical protein LTR53_008187 [Teratosphaeriaceae sp. CCFEE 6253]|nr:hypothetical protein LTR53_008187 [Teratosphaeriaceae sp. CCFEE 6253]